jgi:CHAT domain-containing protein
MPIRWIPGSNLITVSVPDVEAKTWRARVFGLSWALFAAGAQSSLLSDWPVSDESTPLLMQRFYREWTATGAYRHDKAHALQEAQKWMLTHTRFSNAYNWATFVLIGAPR